MEDRPRAYVVVTGNFLSLLGLLTSCHSGGLVYISLLVREGVVCWHIFSYSL